jgi:thiol:disulfide interchange protein DsbD
MLDQIAQYSAYKLPLALLLVTTASHGNPLGLPAPQVNASVVSPAPAASGELLDPEMAFRPQFRLRDATTAEIKFDVVPGYYLYRDRIRVEGVTVEPQVGSRAGKPRQGSAASRATTLLVLTMPAGRYVEDPTFGRVEIYDRSMVVQVDLAPPQTVSKATGATSKSAVAKAPNKFRLTSQGCAAAGVCFPPQQHEFALPATVSGSRDSRTTESGWVLPIAAATSLGFSRPKSPSASIIPTK